MPKKKLTAAERKLGFAQEEIALLRTESLKYRNAFTEVSEKYDELKETEKDLRAELSEIANAVDISSNDGSDLSFFHRNAERIGCFPVKAKAKKSPVDRIIARIREMEASIATYEALSEIKNKRGDEWKAFAERVSFGPETTIGFDSAHGEDYTKIVLAKRNGNGDLEVIKEIGI